MADEMERSDGETSGRKRPQEAEKVAQEAIQEAVKESLAELLPSLLGREREAWRRVSALVTRGVGRSTSCRGKEMGWLHHNR